MKCSKCGCDTKELRKSFILDLKSIAENETYKDMKQAILDFINEAEEG